MTRKMWARRAFRAGWLLAPFLEVPKKTFNHMFRSWASAARYIGLLALIFFCLKAGYAMFMRAQDATAAQITAALQGNWCMIDMMPRRQAMWNRPITVGDLKTGIQDCIEAADKYRRTEEQKAAMKALAK